MKKEYVTARLLFKNRRINRKLNTNKNLPHCDQQETFETQNNLIEKKVDKCDEVAAESSLLSKCLNLIRKVLKTLVSNS